MPVHALNMYVIQQMASPTNGLNDSLILSIIIIVVCVISGFEFIAGQKDFDKHCESFYSLLIVIYDVTNRVPRFHRHRFHSWRLN